MALVKYQCAWVAESIKQMIGKTALLWLVLQTTEWTVKKKIIKMSIYIYIYILVLSIDNKKITN